MNRSRSPIPPAQVSADLLAERSQMTLLGHDLREAMADVLAGLRLIDSGSLSTTDRGHVERAQAAGALLARLLEQSPMYGAEEAAAREAPAGATDLPLLLNELERRWCDVAREKGGGLRLSMPADIPEVIGVHRMVLERILANLLSNAMKHSLGGAVTMSIAGGRDGGALQFIVRDDGPGFSDTALERLFERGGRPADNTIPGSGLGLHIAYRLTQHVGGFLSVCNPEWGGAEVSLILPEKVWALAMEASEPQQMVPSCPEALRGRRILLAEDTEASRLVTHSLLEQAGAKVISVADGAEALRRLRASNFDLVVMDVEMPGMSGLEAMRAFRSLSLAHSGIPTVALTAHGAPEMQARILAAGFDALVRKPLIDEAPFIALLERLPDLRRDGAALIVSGRQLPDTAMPGPLGSAAASEADPIDTAVFDRVLALAGQMPGALGRLRRQKLVERIGADLGKARERIGVALASSLDTEDRAMIRRSTHMLVALAGTLGDTGLSALAEKANRAAHEGGEAKLRQCLAEMIVRLDRLIDLVAAARDGQGGA